MRRRKCFRFASVNSNNWRDKGEEEKQKQTKRQKCRE